MKSEKSCRACAVLLCGALVAFVPSAQATTSLYDANGCARSPNLNGTIDALSLATDDVANAVRYETPSTARTGIPRVAPRPRLAGDETDDLPRSTYFDLVSGAVTAAGVLVAAGCVGLAVATAAPALVTAAGTAIVVAKSVGIAINVANLLINWNEFSGRERALRATTIAIDTITTGGGSLVIGAGSRVAAMRRGLEVGRDVHTAALPAARALLLLPPSRSILDP